MVELYIYVYINNYTHTHIYIYIMIICVCVHMLYETLFAYMISSIVTFLSLLSKPPGPQMIVNV
jgi:hypothetical protein